MPIELTPSSSASELIQNGWFHETEAMWPGQKFSIEVDEVLLNGRSEFQDILVFKSKTYGTVMSLDGVIQVTERDEFAYQEMITHLPLCACKHPKRVLIIGGGDGGVLREVAKHPEVEEIVMCEIDKQVIEVSKVYFKDSLATSFSDPRLTLLIQDAAVYVKSLVQEDGTVQGGYFDAIVCDSSDPVGPANVLFQKAFFDSLKRILNPVGGVLCTQGESLWLHLPLIKSTRDTLLELFPCVLYAYSSIPTYPGGGIGYLLSTSSPDVSPPNVPARSVAAPLRFYSAEMHKSVFVLPRFAEEELYGKK